MKIQRNEQGNLQTQFPGKLVTPLSTDVFQNKNGKNYKLATIEFTNNQGVKKTTTAMVYEGNYTHANANFAVGGSYLATATWLEESQSPIVTLSHLSAASRAEAADFGFEEISKEMLANQE